MYSRHVGRAAGLLTLECEACAESRPGEKNKATHPHIFQVIDLWTSQIHTSHPPSLLSPFRPLKPTSGTLLRTLFRTTSETEMRNEVRSDLRNAVRRDAKAEQSTGFGLPCANCRLYYPANLDVCPACNSQVRVSPRAVPGYSEDAARHRAFAGQRCRRAGERGFPETVESQIFGNSCRRRRSRRLFAVWKITALKMTSQPQFANRVTRVCRNVSMCAKPLCIWI